MLRLMGFIVALLVIVGLATFHGSSSAQVPAHKTLICHVPDNQPGHIIEVALAAVPAHLRNHGDCIINSTDRSLIGNECDPTDANLNDICDIQP